MRDLRRAALLHDLGKLAISNRILDKPAALTNAEFDAVKEHPLITERILRRLPGHAHIAALAAAHHERLDGGGYPRGLSADELTVPMRLLALADVYEALTSERPYRRAMTSDEALDIIRADVPARLDADAFSVLDQVLADGRGRTPRRGPRPGDPQPGRLAPPGFPDARAVERWCSVARWSAVARVRNRALRE